MVRVYRDVLAVLGARGPRMIEVNARMGGARIHQMVEAVWGVDLIEAQLRSCLDLPQTLTPSRRPRCAVANAIVHAPAAGRLAELSFAQVAPEARMGVELDIFGQIGQEVAGPGSTFATTYEPGDMIIRNGEPGDRFYIIAEGRARAAKDGKQLREMGAGESFGEIALLRRIPRTATVTALSRLEVRTLAREEFLAAVTGNPESVERAEEVVSTRFQAG